MEIHSIVIVKFARRLNLFTNITVSVPKFTPLQVPDEQRAQTNSSITHRNVSPFCQNGFISSQIGSSESNSVFIRLSF